MPWINFAFLVAIVINQCANADINVSECIADWLVINRGSEINAELDEAGRYFLESWPIYIEVDDEDQEDRREFDELVAKCVGEEMVQKSLYGQRRKIDVFSMRLENEQRYDDPFYVSRQLGYVLHNIKCVVNYAAIHYENVKVDMVDPRVIKLISDTLPDIINSEMDGFEGLKKCVEIIEMPEDNEQSLIGKIPKFFGTKNENKDVCIVNVNDQNKGDSSIILNCVNVQILKQNAKINRILHKNSVPTKEINDQIVAEMLCVGDFLVTKMMVKTHSELIEKEEKCLIMRSVVKPKERMGQYAEQWYEEQCAKLVIRRNAMRKHGMAGMLEASYGTIYLDPELQKEMDNLSVHLADSLAAKFVTSGGVEIVRLTARSDVFMAKSINTSLFRIQIQHEKCDSNYKISENSESSLYKYIKSMDGTKCKDWEQKTMAELMKIFDEKQLFLSKQFINNYLDQNKGQERKLYSNLTCIADFMVIYEGMIPKFEENGKIVPDGYKTVERDQIGEELFAQLAKCFGEGWVENRDGKMQLNAAYLFHWGIDKYQVSEKLENLLVNLRCVADYLMMNDRNVRFFISLLTSIRIDEETMPQIIRREVENSDEFDKMVQCMKEPSKNYHILGKVVPSLLWHENEQNGDGVSIKLKEPNNTIMEKLLSHAYINEDITDIIRAKFTCIGNALIKQGNARTSLIIRDPEIGEVFRKMTIRNLPENLLEETGCDQIFRNEDDRKWKLEQRLNRNKLLSDKVVEKMLIIDNDLLRKLDQQSMCLADLLATHFWPKHVEEIRDGCYLKDLAEKSGGIEFRFKLPDDLEFREKLEQFLRNAETAEEFVKCIPKLAKTPEDQLLETFMSYLDLFDPDQLFLSKEFDLFGCLGDWLASKFGPKYIAKIDSIDQHLLSYWPGISDYKFQFEKTDEFYAELRRKLPNVKTNEEFKKLAKCVPEIWLFKGEIMVTDTSGELFFRTMRDYLDNLDMKQMCLTDLANCLLDFQPTEDEVNTEDICPICHDEFDEKHGAKRLPNCKHLYHANCIKSWLKDHNRCPYCSATIFS